MQDPKKSSKPDEKPAADTRRGGFGEFAEVYRARWAVNHPHMRPWEYDDTQGVTPDGAPEPRLPAESGDAETHDGRATKPPGAED